MQFKTSALILLAAAAPVLFAAPAKETTAGRHEGRDGESPLSLLLVLFGK